MDQFTVPQFIEREAKILGPITVRQFLICLVGFGLGFLAFKFSDFELFIVEAVIIAGLTVLFAFVPINGRPFHYFILAIVGSLKRSRVRVWKKDPREYKLKTKSSKQKTKEQQEKEKAELRQKQIQEGLAKKQVARSRLSKLSLTVDTAGRYQEDKK